MDVKAKKYIFFFKQSDQPIYSKRVIFSCKSYNNNDRL